MIRNFFLPTQNQKKIWRSVFACVLLSVLSIGLIFAPYRLLQNKHQTARQNWEQSQPGHYKYEALWEGTYFQVEIQDGLVVQVIDLSTHEAPEPYFWSYAKEFVLLDELFQTIDVLFMPPKPGIVEYVSMTYPDVVKTLTSFGVPISSWGNLCVYPLPIIYYDSELGYPKYMKFRHSPQSFCNAIPLELLKDDEVTISNFQLLP